MKRKSRASKAHQDENGVEENGDTLKETGPKRRGRSKRSNVVEETGQGNTEEKTNDSEPESKQTKGQLKKAKKSLKSQSDSDSEIEIEVSKKKSKKGKKNSEVESKSDDDLPEERKRNTKSKRSNVADKNDEDSNEEKEVNDRRKSKGRSTLTKKSTKSQSEADESNEESEETSSKRKSRSKRSEISNDEEDEGKLERKKKGGNKKQKKDQSESEKGDKNEDFSDEDEPLGKKQKKSKQKGKDQTDATDSTDENSVDEAKKNSNDGEYEVETVLDEKILKGVKHYLIRWKGYEPESDTWEPENTLSCDNLIQEFKKKKKSHSHKRKKPKPETEIQEWDENEDFEVDKIIEVHHMRNGKREFLVSWKGYPSSANSWEPEENLSCPDLIEKFMLKVEQAKNFEKKELRQVRSHTDRFTLAADAARRRLSKRHFGKQRVQYHDAE